MNEPTLASTADGSNSKSRALDEVAVALCIYGDDLDPDEVSSLLGVSPTHAHRRNDATGLKSAPFKKGAWILELRRSEPVDLDALYAELLAPLPAAQAVWATLARRYEMRLDFAVHTDAGCSFSVSPETFALMSSRHCAFNISIYAYGSNDALYLPKEGQ
jgi:Domain of unknown function (DUF4279)